MTPDSRAGAKIGGFVVALALFFVWWFWGGGLSASLPNSATESVSPTAPLLGGATTRQVTYKVSGTAGVASLTYENPQGGTVQAKVTLPWSVTLTFRDGDYVYISAQNEGQRGTLTTQILIDGKPWKQTTSEGPYVMADCNGSVAAP